MHLMLHDKEMRGKNPNDICLIYMHVYVLSCSVVSNSLRPQGLNPTRRLCPWNFPGKNTGVDCHFLLEGIFPTRGSILSLASAAFDRQSLYHCTTWEGQYICMHLHAQSLQLCLALCDLWTIAFQTLLYEIL